MCTCCFAQKIGEQNKWVSGYSAVPKQSGWYWLNKSGAQVNHGIMVRVGDNGRVYLRAHYKDADQRILGLATQVPLEWFNLDALRTLCGQFAVGNTKAYGLFLCQSWRSRFGSSDLREMFNKLFYSKLLALISTRLEILPRIVLPQNKGFVRAEHNIKGFKGFRFPTHNEVKCVLEHKNGLNAFEDPSSSMSVLSKFMATQKEWDWQNGQGFILSLVLF